MALQHNDKRFATYSLSGLIEEDRTITVDHELFIVSLVSREGKINEQQKMTAQEYYVMMELFNLHPNYCPYQNILSALSGKSVDYELNRLIKVADTEEYNPVIRPVRNIVARCRLKLWPFGLDISSILETGYMLTRYSEKHRKI